MSERCLDAYIIFLVVGSSTTEYSKNDLLTVINFFFLAIFFPMFFLPKKQSAASSRRRGHVAVIIPRIDAHLVDRQTAGRIFNSAYHCTRGAATGLWEKFSEPVLRCATSFAHRFLQARR